jgi:hypothetical protein
VSSRFAVRAAAKADPLAPSMAPSSSSTNAVSTCRSPVSSRTEGSHSAQVSAARHESRPFSAVVQLISVPSVTRRAGERLQRCVNQANVFSVDTIRAVRRTGRTSTFWVVAFAETWINSEPIGLHALRAGLQLDVDGFAVGRASALAGRRAAEYACGHFRDDDTTLQFLFFGFRTLD